MQVPGAFSLVAMHEKIVVHGAEMHGTSEVGSVSDPSNILTDGSDDKEGVCLNNFARERTKQCMVGLVWAESLSRTLRMAWPVWPVAPRMAYVGIVRNLLRV